MSGNADPTVLAQVACTARQATDYLRAIGLYATARDQSLTITVLLPDIARVCGPEHPNALLVRNNLAE